MQEFVPPNTPPLWTHHLASQMVPSGVVSPMITSVIQEAEAGDTWRVKMVADKDAESHSMAALPEFLRAHGYTRQYVDYKDGQHMLVVERLPKAQAQELVETLKQEGWLSEKTNRTIDQHNAPSFKDSLRRDSLKWSGRFAFLGSAAVAAAGLAQKDQSRVNTGLTLMAADSVVALYGNGKGHINFDRMFHDMHKHFAQNGVDLPDIATPEARKNAIGQLQGFIKSHAIDLNYGLGMLSGIGHIKSGIADFQRSSAGISRITKGVLGAGGSAAVIFIPEDKERKKHLKSLDHYLHHPSEIGQGIKDLFLSSPIKFKGIISTIYSALYFTDTLEERSKIKLWASQQGGEYHGKNMATLKTELAAAVESDALKAMEKGAIEQASHLRQGIEELERRENIAKTFWGGKVSPYLSALTGLSYIAASLLSAASSKSRDKSFETADEYEKMYAMAAQTILGAPAASREDMLQQVAHYLAMNKDVKDGDISAPQIIEEVKQRINTLSDSPWLAAPSLSHPTRTIS